MSQMNAPDVPNLVGIPQEQYDALTAQINAMPARKREHWKAHLTDKWGGCTLCKFANNDIYNWSVAAQAWLKVVVLERPREDEAVSRVGKMLAAGIPHEFAFAIEQEIVKNTGNVDDR